MPTPRSYREEEVMEFIEAFYDRHVLMPTVREIADHLGLASPNAAYKYLRRLREDGRLAWEPRKHRALRVVEHAVR